MTEINYDAIDFPLVYSFGASGRLPVTPAALAWAAVTVGRTPFALPAPRRDRTFEATWRAAMVYANLVPDAGLSSFRRSDAYARLDMSEKSAVSFFLGQVQAKLFAERFFRVGVFAHLDAVLASRGMARSRTRPDFVGFNPGLRLALAVEAKGRSNGWTDALVSDAKRQVAALPGVLAMSAPTNYAHVAFFDGTEWCARLADPPRQRQLADLPAEVVSRAYYAPLVETLRQARGRNPVDAPARELDSHFLWGRLPAAGITLGIARNIADAAGDADPPTQHAEEPGAWDTYLGSDGIAVVLDASWHEWNVA